MIGGRLFGETISGRYDATDLIDNPVMLLEYIKRHQNWDDSGGTVKIKTGSAVGSFDHTSLDEIKALTIARQISDEKLSWTNALCKSICEAFYLVSYQDATGYECVDYILRTDTPTDTVTIRDIVPGSIGLVKSPNPEDILVMPYIDYAYDYATGKFKKQLAITGIDTNSVWSAALTPGFTGTDGEAIWYSCKALYTKYGRIEVVPSNMYGQHWIPDYDTAVWKIQKMVEFQLYKKFSISVFYSTGRSWHPGRQIYIQFPNETDNELIRCCITNIKKNKNNNRVDIELLLLDQVESEFYFVMYQMTDGASTEWQVQDDSVIINQER